MSALKYGDARKLEAETKCKKEYPNYYTSMQKVNQSKTRAHQKPDPILTLNEYCHIDPEADKKAEEEKKAAEAKKAKEQKK